MFKKNTQLTTVKLPYELGEHVYYVERYHNRIECKVDFYKFDKTGYTIHLTPVNKDYSYMSDIWIPVENAEQLIMRKEEKYSSTKSGSTYDMHLYQAIASYDLESELKFLISEVEIDEITDDCVILTKYFQPVSECAVSNRFAGCDALNTNKEFRISKHTYVMYSTWRPKCVRFLLEHLRQAKAKLCIMDDMICKYIEKFQKEYENANV